MKFQKLYIITIVFIVLSHLVLIPATRAANRILPLGDSITQGSSSGVDDASYQVSYRKALYDKLKAAGYVINDDMFVGTLFSGEKVQDFDPDHEGHSGWLADEIVSGRTGSTEGKLSDWLISEKPNVVLLHIGTNDISDAKEDWHKVENILEVIDNYELTSGKSVWVILGLIIDRSCDPFLQPCPKSAETTTFNDSVRNNVFIPREAAGDNILLVDMQHDAGINYDRWDRGGDMWDDLHPFKTGYAKMATLWFTALTKILPHADAGQDQNVDNFSEVTLDGTASFDPDETVLSYQWAQTSGPTVTLSDTTSATPTFIAPDVGAAGETLVFQLTVTDGDGMESADTVDITVHNATSSKGGSGGGCFITASLLPP